MHQTFKDKEMRTMMKTTAFVVVFSAELVAPLLPGLMDAFHNAQTPLFERLEGERA
jgi:hypothetical protein